MPPSGTTGPQVAHALVLLVCLSTCGSDNAVPIDRIQGDKKLVDLSGAEEQGVCQWGEEIARQKLPEGTTCHGNPISIGGCLTVAPACTATVAEWKLCIPALLDRFAQDPCAILNLAFSQSEFASFIDETTGCQGLGVCGTTMVMGH